MTDVARLGNKRTASELDEQAAPAAPRKSRRLAGKDPENPGLVDNTGKRSRLDGPLSLGAVNIPVVEHNQNVKSDETRHAIERTETFIKIAHEKRLREGDTAFDGYLPRDGKGEPSRWSVAYLADHVDDVHALMKFSDPKYNASLLAAALEAPDGIKKANMLYQFAGNAGEFDDKQCMAIASKAATILYGEGAGAAIAAQALVTLEKHAEDNEALSTQIAELHRSAGSALEATEKRSEILEQARRNPDLQLEIRLAQAATSEYPDKMPYTARRDALVKNIKGHDARRTEGSLLDFIKVKYRASSDEQAIQHAANDLRYDSISHLAAGLAVDISKRFPGAMTQRQLEQTSETISKPSASEKRAELATRGSSITSRGE